jgi:5,10-methylenetetrahydromethanopterin reductase
MAGDTALLDHLTNGRAFLGIARGAWLERHGIREVTPPVRAFRECIQIVRSLWSGEEIPSGKLFPVAANVSLPYPRLRTRIPILVGTWGPKLGKLAGELADEVKIGGGTNPAMVRVMRGYIAGGERLAGHPANHVGIAIGAVTVVDEDSRAAKQWVKRDLALYLPVVAGLDVTANIDPELLKRIGTLVDSHQIDDAVALISDDILAKFAFAGSPDEVLAHAQSLYDAGARRVEFGTPHGLRPGSGIRLLGERVLPHLKLARM